MKIEGRFLFHAPIPVVYDALQNAELIHKAMPGGLLFARTSPSTFEAAMEVNVPKFSGHYAGTVTIVNTEVNRFYDLFVQGTGAHSHITATGVVTLEGVEDQFQTQVIYVGHTDAADHLNRFAQAVVQRIAIEVINLGLRRLEGEVQRRREAERNMGEPGGPTPPSGPSEPGDAGNG
jgi:carbon monoxide dehydrogenase subunit G